jgi:hypothetical protein
MNRTKTYLLIIFLILIFSGCGFNKNELSQKEEFDLKLNCSNFAKEYIEKIINRNYPSITYSEKFNYNKKLNTCIVYYIIREKGVGTTYNIADSLTDKTLYQYIYWDNPNSKIKHNIHCNIDNGCFLKKKILIIKY